MTKEFKGQSGAKIVINEAEWDEVKTLKNCIFKEILKYNLDIDMTGVTTLAELKDALGKSIPNAINLVKNIALGCDSSPDFEKAVFACLKHCLYDGIQITDNLFNDKKESRKDYYIILQACLEVNIYPFFTWLETIISVFKQYYKKIESDLNTQQTQTSSDQ